MQHDLTDEQRRDLIARFRKACLEFRGGDRDDEAHAELIAAQTALYAALASAPAAPDAHALWAAAQLVPGEGIEDGVARIEALLGAASAPAAEPVAWQYRVNCGGTQGWSHWITADKAGIDARPDRYLPAIFEVRALYTGPHFDPQAQVVATPSAVAALQAVVDFIEGKPDAPEPFGMVRAALAHAKQAKPIVYVNRQGFRSLNDVAHPRKYAQMEQWMKLYYMPLFADPTETGV